MLAGLDGPDARENPISGTWTMNYVNLKSDI